MNEELLKAITKIYNLEDKLEEALKLLKNNKSI